ncbi:A disintegrin and metalloproteinase with thrombospondin motifs adt-2-like [Ruditapes philippinarum]|uniref:A disintegrin and metalloproteinase with thrombospondin motifs adt-2-like n=1 Tax=Ruditapes philippinarum TaxID=129788 RepID=UPI00295B567A|nr:A disintegrin and metalloproteinase with thrombospondin motifs adt-2-like [Ruditapes philippinarum]
MHYLLITWCACTIITTGSALHASYFQDLQEIENVHISHKMIHRIKRQVSQKYARIPDIILTEIIGGNRKSFLKFRRKRKRPLSPIYILNEEKSRMGEKTDTVQCTHLYEDIQNSAHALVDRCAGTSHVTVVAEVVLDNQMYMILPKDLDKSHIDTGHGLFIVNMTRNFSNDYKIPDLSRVKDNSIPNVNHRLRRAADRTFVELMLVVDYSLYSFWRAQTTGTEVERDAAALDLIQKMYTFLGNGIHLRYQGLQTTYGLDIDVELTGIYVLQTAEESAFTQNADTTLFSRGVIDGEILLGEFEKWIKTQKISNRDTFMNKDHYMLLTAREIALTGNAGAAGYAYTGEICTDKSVSIVEDKVNFISVVTAAHELGHSLGGLHDKDAGDQNCQDEYGFILSSINSVYIDSRATHPWKFSPCSANAFKSKLDDLKASGNNCLKEDDTETVLQPTGSPPGQLYPPDKQCQLMLDPDSVMFRQRHSTAWERICTAMACTQLGFTKVTYVIPADGTTCGNKKWCWNGKCVTAVEAPEADESCLHGDQTGNFISGASCATTLAGDQLWKCYQVTIEQPCCATCGAGKTDIEGCKYGDESDCSQISSKQCYDKNIHESQCCKTCHDFAQSYVNLPADCKYGDRKAGCDRSDTTCSRFYTDCCATCSGYTPPSTPPTDKPTTPPVTSDNQNTPEKTTQEVTTLVTPLGKKEEGLPSWVLPVVAGAAGVIVLSIIIGVCAYCMKQSPSKKYKGEGNTNYNTGRYRQRASVDTGDKRKRHRSEDNRRTSDEKRDRRRRSEDVKREDRRDRRRSSEDSRGGHRNYDRRPSNISSHSRY